MPFLEPLYDGQLSCPVGRYRLSVCVLLLDVFGVGVESVEKVVWIKSGDLSWWKLALRSSYPPNGFQSVVGSVTGGRCAIRISVFCNSLAAS